MKETLFHYRFRSIRQINQLFESMLDDNNIKNLLSKYTSKQQSHILSYQNKYAQLNMRCAL